MQRGKWRGIASAPRDGTFIIVFAKTKTEGPRPLVARYSVDEELGEYWETAVVDSFHPRCGVKHLVHVHPTHWMALPANPKGAR
jgi:hypothetical protein